MDFGVMGCRSNVSSDLGAVGINTRTHLERLPPVPFRIFLHLFIPYVLFGKSSYVLHVVCFVLFSVFFLPHGELIYS